MNKITHDAVVSYDRNRALTVKNPTNVFVTRYNNQTKVFEILTYTYEGQRMQKDILSKAPIVPYKRNMNLCEMLTSSIIE